MKTLIESLAFACLLGTVSISYEGALPHNVDSELYAEPGGVSQLPPPPVN